MKKIFKGEYRFLSNFYPVEVKLYGVTFSTVEHAYQAAKTSDFNAFVRISELRSHQAGKAKRIGRGCIIRSDWEEVKFSIMEDLLKQKFNQEDLKKKLFDTKEEELIEGNYWHDNIWGDCECLKCENIIGENHLGKLLMKIRGGINEKDILV